MYLGHSTICLRGDAISAKRPYALARLALPIVGGVLALVAPSLAARAQAPPANAEPKIRILSVSTPPLADQQLPEGGLLPALVKASLGRSKSGEVPKIEVRWATTLTQQVLNDPTVDLLLPVEGANCDRPNELSQLSAVVCDHAVRSAPILEVVLGLFSLANGSFKFESEDGILGRTVCLAREQDLAALDANGRNWASYKRVTVLRRASLLDCVVAVQAHEADAFAAIDLEGAHLLRRLGLAPYFAMQPRPLATRGVHAVVWREHPRATDILDALNDGVKQLKQGGTYAALIQQHLMAAASPAAVAGRPKTAPAPMSAVSTASVAPPGTSQQAAPRQPVAAPLPVLDEATRATALKYLKRGNDELAEGRVAPARLLYERAAGMGLAQAAMALAGTYDARELSRPHLRNILPEPAEAKRWYERARALGAADAGAKLQHLGSNGR